jgi:hypothetical protein
MLTLLINETKPLAGLFASTTGGIGSVPDISVADEGQAVSVQTFTRTAGVITDSFVAGDVLHIGIGDGVNAPVCYIELSSASPATGTMAINTVGMVALFAATSANQLTLNVGVVRTRGGYTNTIFSAPIVIHRSVIDPDTAVPTPSILGTGVAAALLVAINTALGFVRLDASARYPALDGSQITNLAGGSLTVGTTAIASGTTGRILYDNAGVLGELPVGTGVATALAVNVGSAGAFLTSAVTSITGTANEITVTGTTTPTLSLPSALTFTGKTVTGGTFTGGAFNGTVGATTPSTIAGTTGTFSGVVSTTGADAHIYTQGDGADISTYGAFASIITHGGGHVQTSSTFKLDNGAYITTLSHAPTTDRAIAFPDAAGTLALTSNITGGTLAGSFTTLTASATTSLLLGTAGSAVGNVGFRNATSGTTTLQPATGALGTGTVTLPLSGTLAISSGAQTFTGVQSMTSPAITTSITTPSTTFALVNATATTVNFAGGASTALNIGNASGTNTILGTTIFSTPGSVDLRNGTSSSVFSIYGYYSDASNYCRIATSYNDGGNLFTISSDGLGTRANRNFGILSQAILYLGGNSTYAWRITSAGLLAHADNTYDIGASGATRPRHLYIGSNGVFGGTLSVTGASTLTGLLTANGGITLGDAQNIAFNTTTGTKIGATTSQKIGFWNSTPIVQPTTAVASATVAHAGGGTNIKTDDTFDGYTIAQVVKALRNAGLLA